MNINFSDIKRPDDFRPIPNEILAETMIPQFEKIVSQYADRLAIKSENHQLNYGELNNAVNNLTFTIMQVLGEDKSPVAFMFNDEVFSIIAMLAIMKSGKPFVGIYPGNSPDLVNGILDDSTSKLLIINSSVTEKLGKDLKIDTNINVIYLEKFDKKPLHKNPKFNGKPEEIIGIFYTSGSTGMPKGIICSNLARAQSVQYMVNEWFISPSDHIALLTSVCYLASFPSLFGALMTGALLCIFDLKKNSAQKSLDWISKEELTIFRSTPTIFRAIFSLAPMGKVFHNLRFMTLGGESVSETDIELFKAHTNEDCVVINNYAATETGSICHYPVGHDTFISRKVLPAGFPAPGKEVFLVNENGDNVKEGEEGEVVVRSQYLNLGYWRKPELTVQKFQDDISDSNFRLCSTGDRGYWGEGGELVIAGRKDTQVKVRGYRIQLEAIDHELLSIDGIKNAVTIVHKAPRRGDRLVSYFVASDQETVSISQLRIKLSAQLPSYMIPSVFVQMDSLPMTATGKITRSKLPLPTRQRPDLAPPLVGPRNEIETAMVNIWQDVLELDQIGVNDNFFELGGDSLVALEMTLSIEKTFFKTIPQSFFANPTVSHLREVIFDEDIYSQHKQEAFVLESFKKDKNTSPSQKKTKRKISWFGKLVRGGITTKRINRLLDLIVTKYIASLSYQDANRWIVKFSQNMIARKLLYSKRYSMFSRWLADITSIYDHNDLPKKFQRNMITNLQNKLRWFKGTNDDPKRGSIDIETEIRRLKNSPSKYWSTLGKLIEETPIDKFDDQFPVKGLHYLTDAIEEGRGVILLSFHGFTTPLRFLPLKWRLGIDIFTISYLIPISQSQFHESPMDLSKADGSVLNAEIALYGQRILQSGGVVNILGDSKDPHGNAYQIEIGGREHEVKSGFAEIAINTGATVIPHFGRSLADGRPEMTFLPPLEFGNIESGDIVGALMNQYAAFINHVWANYPEAVRWIKIERYFNQHLIN